MFGKKEQKSLEQEPLRIGNNKKGTPQYQEWREKFDQKISARRKMKLSIGGPKRNPALPIENAESES